MSTNEEPREPNAAEKAAAPAGAAAGALAGGAAGTLIAGPVGTAIGAIAGAIGGWWAGSGVAAHAELPPSDESYYRTHYEASAPAGGKWDDARPAYQIGHAAAANPEYRGRSFSDIEADLQHGWRDDAVARAGNWPSVRDLARCAYEHRANLVRAEREFADPGGSESSSAHASKRVDFGPHSPDASRREFRGGT